MENQDTEENESFVDEANLMSIMAGKEEKPAQAQAPKEPLQQNPVSKQKGKPKNTIEDDYEKLFIRDPGTTARNGKPVYIRPEFHERLSRIVHVIGHDKLSIYAYLDNVLELHFQQYGEQITKSFNDNYKPIL